MTKNQNDAIKKLIGYGFKPVPIPYKQKSPVKKGWTQYKATKENIKKDFLHGKPMNVGILNGKASGNIVDIDVDHPTALDFTDMYLPQTGMVFGRKSKPSSHLIYRCDELPKNQKFQSSDGCIIEIRSTGTQTVFPPSTHPTGELIQFEKDGAPSKVDKNILEQACRVITVGTILVENYPEEGVRNDFAMVLSAISLRLFDGDVKNAERFVKKVATLARDEEAKKRANVVDYTAKRMENGEETVGLPTLAGFVGQEVAKDIAKYIGADFRSNANDAIEDLNEEFAFVIVPPSSQIIRERKNKGGHTEFDLLHTHTFKQLISSRWHGQKKLAQAWLDSPKRRTYEGLEFAPQYPTEGKYNLFQGFPVRPAKGDCGLYLDHIKNIICGGNDEYYQYFIAWMANIIQSAEKKIGTAIVIRGNQGTGKSTVFEHFGVLLGGHYKIADNARYISGNFNSHLHDCLLLHLEEAFYAGDKKLEASLKEMITGDTILMEYKGREPLRAKNYARLAITTNSNWAVPAGLEERRFFILEALNDKQQDKAYFGKIAYQMQNGGYEALMDYLMSYQYDPDVLRTVPKTGALLEQKMHSLSREQDWWFNILKNGCLPCQDGWTGVCGTDHMHDDLYQHAKLLGGHYRPSKTALGIFIKRMVPNVAKHRGSYQCSDTFDDTEKETERGHYYAFPSLEECRCSFEEQVGQKIEWD